jgi:DTW domain-containing protein YfiP
LSFARDNETMVFVTLRETLLTEFTKEYVLRHAQKDDATSICERIYSLLRSVRLSSLGMAKEYNLRYAQKDNAHCAYEKNKFLVAI